MAPGAGRVNLISRGSCLGRSFFRHLFRTAAKKECNPRGHENEASHFPMDLTSEQDFGTEEVVGSPSPSVEYPQLDFATAVPTETKEFCENYPSDPETTSYDDVELPSNVTDRKQIFMPMDLKRDDPRIHGKWLWFSNGDLYLQDQIWIQLANLILQGLVILQESSTARSCRDRGRQQGIIKCYTRDGVEAIKKAGLAIQRIVNDGVILHYKSNKASDDSKNRMYGDRFISEYMLTACGGLYAKDELKRWKKVDSKSPKRPEADPTDGIPYRWSLLSDLGPMPSYETIKKRYFYPEYSSVAELDGSWSFFCSIGDFDRHGHSELDRVWFKAKGLVDDGVVDQATCETKGYIANSSHNPLSRCVSCVIKDYSDISRVVGPVDRLKRETGYEFPVYFKVCHINADKKKLFLQKYLYSDDRELYEYVNEQWQLVAKGDDLNAHS